jgi:DNA-binding transcriptional MerR regulator
MTQAASNQASQDGERSGEAAGERRPTVSNGMLKMSELAERSGVSAATIKHYLREGLLGPGDEVVRTSRNMAYYPLEFVERVRLIKRLQEERFMPLRVIRELLGADPHRAARLIELEDRIIERAIEAGETGRTTRAAVRETYDVPENVLRRLEELGVLTPNARGYDADDVKIIGGLRPGDRVHGVRHAPLPPGARAARRGGGASLARPTRRQGRGRPCGRDHLVRG